MPSVPNPHWWFQHAPSLPTALYAECGDEFLSYAVSLSGNEELARDALQEVFMRYFVARCNCDEILPAHAWIYKVMHKHFAM